MNVILTKFFCVCVVLLPPAWRPKKSPGSSFP